MEFKVGDIVRVRPYEQLEEEWAPRFLGESDGFYCNGVFFNPEMKICCGIEGVITDRHVSPVSEKPVNSISTIKRWVFADCMLEEVYEIEPSDDLNSFLDGWKS